MPRWGEHVTASVCRLTTARSRPLLGSGSPRRGAGCHYVVMAGRVLLVEDDATIGEVLTASLRSHAYEVWWERTGAGGLARAEAGAIDLVLLDLGLPDLDGVA